MKVKPIKYREWYFLICNHEMDEKYKGTWLEGASLFVSHHTVRPLLRWWQKFHREKFPSGYRIKHIYLPNFWKIVERDR